MHYVIDFYKDFSSDFEERSDDPPKNTPEKRGILSPLCYESDRVDNERIFS